MLKVKEKRLKEKQNVIFHLDFSNKQSYVKVKGFLNFIQGLSVIYLFIFNVPF